MSKNRCRNTLATLSEIYDRFEGDPHYVEELSEDERKAFHRVVGLCEDMLEVYVFYNGKEKGSKE